MIVIVKLTAIGLAFCATCDYNSLIERWWAAGPQNCRSILGPGNSASCNWATFCHRGDSCPSDGVCQYAADIDIKDSPIEDGPVMLYLCKPEIPTT
jgi:hypothetical protein